MATSDRSAATVDNACGCSSLYIVICVSLCAWMGYGSSNRFNNVDFWAAQMILA